MTTQRKTELLDSIRALYQQIRMHDELYYNHSAPVISDGEYDALKTKFYELRGELLAIEPSIQGDFLELPVGAIADPRFKKVKHAHLMLSLNNAFTTDEVIDFMHRAHKVCDVQENERIQFCCEPKIDGVSFSAVFKNGKLSVAGTRGDGQEGEDITNSILEMATFPGSVDYPDEFEVRGEVYMLKSNFLLLNRRQLLEGKQPFANPRNAASGSLKHINTLTLKARNLQYFVWGGFIDGVTTQYELLMKLKGMGFVVNPCIQLCSTIDEITKYYRTLEFKRSELDYDIDGLVYKINDLAQQEKAGIVGGRAPRWAIAHKFPAVKAVSRILGITVQVGRTGTLTPVAELEPVAVGGVLVTRASLHNEDEIMRKGYRVGDTVTLERAGDVIPKVLDVLEESRHQKSVPFVFPTICPVCGSATEKNDNYAIRRCTGGMKCSAQAIGRLSHFVSKSCFNILGLGEAQIGELYRTNIIRTPVDIFTLQKRNGKSISPPLQEREGWGVQSVQKLLESIQQSKSISFEKFIYALGISHIGQITSKLLAKHFQNVWEFAKVTDTEETWAQLEKINGIGKVGIAGIQDFFKDPANVAIINGLLKHVTVQEYPTKMKKSTNSEVAGKTFVFTGTLSSMDRSKAKAIVTKMGGVISGSITTSTDFLVRGTEPGSKLSKAMNMNVQILAEEDFLKLCGIQQ
ncbi:NAD-dependent DNA ligase LigA [Rickettsiales endosymbiont of Peranema trichophorum]|uniref:NAD-dependent DNA ligase LigA n=1 Tax=Rickettsiales endosymbiont of Peranema trichophorum TaxID=2486577 RepID=UPI001A922DCA|nr:NAD-dependent DNA ligase LigA [Rickettsiales endosymbiont of Peranema trichophorum]